MTKSSKKCPICQSFTTEAHAPFCSARCKDADLYQWLIGSYAIPADETADVFGDEEGEE